MPKRSPPATSPHFPPSKKSRTSARPDTKYYAVRVGRKPGVYSTWADCQKQIVGFPNASFKSFFSKKEAADFVAGRYVAPGPQEVRYYGLIAGHTRGVFTDWRIVESIIKGAKSPKYKKFATEAEAVAFVEGEGAVAKEIKVEKPVKPKAEKKDTPASVQSQTPSSSSDPIIVYSDGSALGNGKVGARAGVGVFFGAGDPRNVSERLKGPLQTNQRAELTAVLRTLQGVSDTEPLLIRTDSMYSINCITVWSDNWMRNNWQTRGGDVKNKDLVEAIREIYDRRLAKGTVTKFEWVKGHAGHPGNEAADRLANAGAVMPEADDDGEL